MEVEEEGGRLYTYHYTSCHNQNDSCIKMGSDESHFNISLTARDKVTRQCPQTTITMVACSILLSCGHSVIQCTFTLTAIWMMTLRQTGGREHGHRIIYYCGHNNTVDLNLESYLNDGVEAQSVEESVDPE